MEQPNLGFCHFEPALTGFTNDMECQVNGENGQRNAGVANIGNNSSGLPQQPLNSIFENSEFSTSSENHFDHHHSNFPATSAQFFMPGEMFSMATSSNSSMFNFPAPSFLSQADISRLTYPLMQRGSGMQGLLGSTMDHHPHHHPHLPHQLTHPIFPMHRFPDLLNAGPEVFPALNFHPDIRNPSHFFKPSVQFSMQTGHQQQQNIKLPLLPMTTSSSPAPAISSSVSSSSLSQSIPSMSKSSSMAQTNLVMKAGQVHLPGGRCEPNVFKAASTSSFEHGQREMEKSLGDGGNGANLSSSILKFSEDNKLFVNDFINFQKASNSTETMPHSSHMVLASTSANMDSNKTSSIHQLPPSSAVIMQPVALTEDDVTKSKKSGRGSKQKQKVIAANASETQNTFSGADKNADIVNTILQMVNETKCENIDQHGALPSLLPGMHGDVGRETMADQRTGSDEKLMDMNLGVMDEKQQQQQIVLPQQNLVSLKLDTLVQVDDSQCVVVDNQKRWRCSQCPKMYSTKHNLITHMLGHKGIKPHFCSLCGKYFKQVSHLHTHMLTHGKIKPHTCPVCFRSFTQSCHVKRHMVIHQQDKTHACQVCGRNFAYPNDLKKHLLKHEDPKDGKDALDSSKHGASRRHISSLTCEQCQLSFESKEKLLNHRALEHRDTYACAECDKVFAYPSQLKHHSSKHNNIRPFICRECGENFMKEHHLKAHMFTHTGLKPYGCTTCGRAFNQKANLRRHTLIHEAQKKFACDVCGKMFTQLQILRAHLITHREQKPFQCKICDKRFSRLHNLNGHMHLHGGERPYVCSCGSSFTLKGNLNRHKKDKNCQPIEMIELDEIDTKPIFDAITVETVTVDPSKPMESSSGEEQRNCVDGSKKKRKSMPRKNISKETSGDEKREGDNMSPSWQSKQEEEEEDDEVGYNNGNPAGGDDDPNQRQNNYIELLSVKEYLFEKTEEGEKFNSSGFSFPDSLNPDPSLITGNAMYSQGVSTNQSMPFLSFASESTNCSLGADNSLTERMGSDGNDAASEDNVDKDLSTTDDDYEYDDHNLLNDGKVPSMSMS